MLRQSELLSLAPRWLRETPGDLAAVVATLVLVDAAVLSGVDLLVVPATFLLIFFLPGYSVIAAVFPEATDDGLSIPTRLGLSVGTSVFTVAAVGLALNFVVRIELPLVLVSVSALTVGAAVQARQRRERLPAEQRFDPPLSRWLSAGWSELINPPTVGAAVLNVLLVGSVVLVLGVAAYTAAVPGGVPPDTEFYILSDTDEGEAAVGGYPDRITSSEPVTVGVGIENNADRAVTYTVVAQIQRLDTEQNQSRVVERQQLQQFDVTVDPGSRFERSTTVRPSLTGDDLRLAFLLYEGAPPATPTTENAPRSVHLWLTVDSRASVSTVQQLPPGNHRRLLPVLPTGSLPERVSGT